MLPCNLGGDKHKYSVQPSPYNFIVFKCTLCPKFCYIPKVIFYKQMMALGVYNPHIKPKEATFLHRLVQNLKIGSLK